MAKERERVMLLEVQRLEALSEGAGRGGPAPGIAPHKDEYEMLVDRIDAEEKRRGEGGSKKGEGGGFEASPGGGKAKKGGGWRGGAKDAEKRLEQRGSVRFASRNCWEGQSQTTARGPRLTEVLMLGRRARAAGGGRRPRRRSSNVN